ncbi:hypothetical protein, partial [Virgibacillus pantothenticus]|uniref:hypothetical protein n=1 Tax=Virgibacillus pantothenticus TaxID=1473 RepID=UPI001C226FCA
KSPYDKSSSVRYLTVIPLSQLIRSIRYVAKRALAPLFERILLRYIKEFVSVRIENNIIIGEF